jgi:hypothetical protein
MALLAFIPAVLSTPVELDSWAQDLATRDSGVPGGPNPALSRRSYARSMVSTPYPFYDPSLS